MRSYRCQQTEDLLNWQPSVVDRLDEARVKSSNLAGKVCRVISEAMRNDTRSREEIAQNLSSYLGEAISRDSLDAFASEARESANISGYRLIGLSHVLRSKALLNELLIDQDWIVVDGKYHPFIELQRAEEARARIERQIKGFHAQIRGIK